MIEVWLVDTDVDASPDSLSPEERERAARFRFEEHRRRWIAAHVALREILSTYTNDVQFVIGENGKPSLANGAVHFNLSHSGDLAVIAVSDHEIGVDVEQIRDDFDYESIAPAANRDEFYREWTRKEARLKARGLGLGASEPLPGHPVPRSPGNSHRVTGRLGDRATATEDLSVEDLAVRDGYAAAVATISASPGEVRNLILRGFLKPAAVSQPAISSNV
jgi:4'-phosphopantetheinyl transferase